MYRYRCAWSGGATYWRRSQPHSLCCLAFIVILTQSSRKEISRNCTVAFPPQKLLTLETKTFCTFFAIVLTQEKPCYFSIAHCSPLGHWALRDQRVAMAACWSPGGRLAWWPRGHLAPVATSLCVDAQSDCIKYILLHNCCLFLISQ